MNPFCVCPSLNQNNLENVPKSSRYFGKKLKFLSRIMLNITVGKLSVLAGQLQGLVGKFKV